MGRTVIVSRRHDDLSQLIMKKMYDAVNRGNFKLTFQRGDELCWLPQVGDPVDDEVQMLATVLDQSVFLPRKIVMLSMAGTADEVDGDQLRKWYGSRAQEELWAHQYAIKMIDEFELPYTILRTPPLVAHSAPAVLTDEGQPLVGTGVSAAELAGVIERVLLTDQYNGKSLGITASEVGVQQDDQD